MKREKKPAEPVREEPTPEQAEVSTPPEADTAALLADQEEKYLRLLAEYDNYRKRTQKEKEAIWGEAKAQASAAFFPVYDNLERALKQETTDAAYAKGVEMTMNGLRAVLEKLGIHEIQALGAPFDPTCHNAVMHEENPDLGQNVVSEVFQTGFTTEGKVVRCAMVKVAN